MLGDPLKRERMFASGIGKRTLCATPGMKIRSLGRGRGLGIGKGSGPLNLRNLRKYL